MDAVVSMLSAIAFPPNLFPYIQSATVEGPTEPQGLAKGHVMLFLLLPSRFPSP